MSSIYSVLFYCCYGYCCCYRLYILLFLLLPFAVFLMMGVFLAAVFANLVIAFYGVLLLFFHAVESGSPRSASLL